MGNLRSGAVKMLVSVILLAVIFHQFNVSEIMGNMFRANVSLLIAGIVVFVLSGIIGGYKWWLLLRFHGMPLDVRGTVSRYFMGLFFNYLLPGFIGGDVIRVYKTAVVSGRATPSFSSTLADRVSGLFVMVLFSLGAYAIMPRGSADSALPVAVLMFSILVAFICLFVFRTVGELVMRVFSRFLPDGITEKIDAVYEEMHVLMKSPPTLLWVFLLSCAVQVARIGVHYFCGRAVGIELGFLYFALFVPLVEIVASMPVSFAGLGVRESMAVLLFAFAGVPEESVVSYTLLATAAGFMGSMPGGLLFALSIGDRRK